MSTERFNISGLNSEEVIASRQQHGDNRLQFHKKNPVLEVLTDLAKEPMVVLLLAASVLYFISGEKGDGIFMACSILLVAAISLYQDNRSRNALEKLKEFSQPNSKVIRNGETISVPTAELVIGDHILVEEGMLVPADARIIHSNDFSVNESILTGESLPVYKDALHSDPYLYSGTSVSGGLAVAVVSAIGNHTKLGGIGKSLADIAEEPTPLEKQISSFVKKMVILGIIVFAIVWAINFYQSGQWLGSLLKALTLAMSILPEEIPVAFTTFMALGAWRLMKLGIVVKQMKTVETLGSATVICTDKTGTLTENRMSLARIYVPESKKIIPPSQFEEKEAASVIRTAMWASEPIPFDPMEIALHEAYMCTSNKDERPQYGIIHEYPLDGKPPMMTHIFQNSEGRRIIAAKGAPEALLSLSGISEEEKIAADHAVVQLATEGYRILGVGEAFTEGDRFPRTQQELRFRFSGLVAFYDPPKKNISSVLQKFYRAGISVKVITGDNAATTMAIAKETGIQQPEKQLSGEELMQMPETELNKAVQNNTLFTRMFPEAKLRIINALKADGEIVAMTGDGVNDGPALKAAHIGIAMGRKGSEIAKQAASLVLLEDDLARMVDAISMGRKIYTNLKKAIRYIISIHIPIILTVFLPLALGWIYPNIFSPVHVIFLELIMGPTCSIIYENEPKEKNTMAEKPRPFSSTFFNRRELTVSILQGLAITAGTLTAYQYAVQQQADETLTRSMVFLTLISANIFLTLVNRSFYYSLLTTLGYANRLVPLIIIITIVITTALIFFPPFASFFGFSKLPVSHAVFAILTGAASVLWYELVKWGKRIQN